MGHSRRGAILLSGRRSAAGSGGAPCLVRGPTPEAQDHQGANRGRPRRRRPDHPGRSQPGRGGEHPGRGVSPHPRTGAHFATGDGQGCRGCHHGGRVPGDRRQDGGVSVRRTVSLIHAPGESVWSHRSFWGRPLISCRTRLRTVWKYRRLFRTDAFRSASVSNSRLCVARRRNSFQKRSIGFSFGLYDGSRYNSRCGLSAKACVTAAPRCQGALSMTNTTRRWRPFGYVLPTCRRCAANAACIRRFLLGWPGFFLPAGHSSVVACTAALSRFITANTYSRPLLSRVPTSGRCPLTPNVAARVGTKGSRASSWLSKTSSSLSAPLLARPSPPG